MAELLPDVGIVAKSYPYQSRLMRPFTVMNCAPGHTLTLNHLFTAGLAIPQYRTDTVICFWRYGASQAIVGNAFGLCLSSITGHEEP
jgi:hypothetical protein